MLTSPPASRRPRCLLGLATAALTGFALIAPMGLSTASAASRSGASTALPAARVAGAAFGLASAPDAGITTGLPGGITAGSASVADLTLIGTTTHVTVRRIYRSGQKHWVDHIVATRLVDTQGCQARQDGTTWRRAVYRSSVYAVCPEGPQVMEEAAAALVRSRPWYRVTVERVPLVAFTLVGDLPSGNDQAVPAALAELPTGPAVFFEGDDVSLTYAGPGVTQAQLDAAVAAFARALGLTTAQVKVSALAA